MRGGGAGRAWEGLRIDLVLDLLGLGRVLLGSPIGDRGRRARIWGSAWGPSSTGVTRQPRKRWGGRGREDAGWEWGAVGQRSEAEGSRRDSALIPRWDEELARGTGGEERAASPVTNPQRPVAGRCDHSDRPAG